MKKSFLIILSAFILLNSCQKEIISPIQNEKEMLSNAQAKGQDGVVDTAGMGAIIPIEESPLKKYLKLFPNQSLITTKNTTLSYPSTLYDLKDLPLNIVVKGNTTADRFFTSQGTNQEVLLAPENSNNPHQRFKIGIMPLTGYIYIKNVEDKLVSAGVYTNNPNVDILYVKDNTNSIGAMWNFIESYQHKPGYTLQNADVLGFDGPEPTIGNVYNKVIGGQANKIYFGKNFNQLNQTFELRVIGDYEIQNIEYLNDARATITQIPDFIVNWSYSNGSSVQQSMTTNFGSKASKTSNFSEQNSFSLKVSTSFKAKVPFLASGSIETEVGSSQSYTYGQSESSEDTRTYDFPLLVPAKTKVTATAKVAKFKLNVPYIATLRDKNTGYILKVAGVWEGVDLTDIDVTVNETSLVTGVTTLKAQFKK
ncbi:aerolysin family beta-barrel pore-forming toxin [Sphingobacterium faecium]|uniref:aerolysin family beta-barrel pore-forming toxin n=1 Tax=Sphingobacterium faecium TaxID=34087 RepID=UPI00320ACD63